MVTIVIVVILASVSFVAASRVKEKANAAACMSNLRQVGVMMNGVATENHGVYPAGGNPRGYISRVCAELSPEYPNTGGKKDAPYFETGAGQIFICPSDKDGLTNLNKSYLANGRIVGVKREDGEWLNSAYSGKRLAAIKHPSRVFLVIEDWRKDSKLWRGNDIRYKADPQEDDCHAHGASRNYLYVDGHVETHGQDPGVSDEGFKKHYLGE
jgi:prepilin-type processing-associated H-X9-DG protein